MYQKTIKERAGTRSESQLSFQKYGLSQGSLYIYPPLTNFKFHRIRLGTKDFQLVLKSNWKIEQFTPINIRDAYSYLIGSDKKQRPQASLTFCQKESAAIALLNVTGMGRSPRWNLQKGTLLAWKRRYKSLVNISYCSTVYPYQESICFIVLHKVP